ncbi:DUF2290 domain-containing protein [Nostoc sp.]|uniref:DUF2290 domain-containing protein n=1 Tax=Nostoc sp. TaxID=1180 RepID=UPI002FF9D3E2
MNLTMMEEGFRKSKKILNACNLFQNENYTRGLMFKPSKFSRDFFTLAQNGDYHKLYQLAITNKDYDILLNDYSFFQFSCESNASNKIVKYRYAYYETPSEFPTYEEFVNELGFSYIECGEEFFQDYEQVIDEAKLKKTVTPLRYDYDEDLHEPPVHPISHLHLGFQNEIRVPIKYILTPHAFVSFVIRHIYWNKWKDLMSDSKFCSIYYVKAECKILPEKHFGIDEEKDFYIA